jgi:hypothetical protein
MAVDVVAALDARERPAVLFQRTAHLFAGHDFHGASSAASWVRPSSCATASQPFRGFTEIRANLVKRLALGVAAGEGGDGSGIAARLGFGSNHRRQDNGDINSQRRGWSSCTAHGQVPPVPQLIARPM